MVIQSKPAAPATRIWEWIMFVTITVATVIGNGAALVYVLWHAFAAAMANVFIDSPVLIDPYRTAELLVLALALGASLGLIGLWRRRWFIVGGVVAGWEILVAVAALMTWLSSVRR